LLDSEENETKKSTVSFWIPCIFVEQYIGAMKPLHQFSILTSLSG